MVTTNALCRCCSNSGIDGEGQLCLCKVPEKYADYIHDLRQQCRNHQHHSALLEGRNTSLVAVLERIRDELRRTGCLLTITTSLDVEEVLVGKDPNHGQHNRNLSAV